MGDSNAGIFAGLIGLTLLVMGGIGISLLADNQSVSIDKSNSLVKSIAAGKLRISELEAEMAIKEQRLTSQQQEKRERAELYAQRSTRRANLKLQLEELRAQETGLTEAFAALDHDYSEYRDKLRNTRRRMMLGAYLGDIPIRGGKTLKSARIIEFKPGVVRLSHTGGNYSLPLSQLSPTIKERILWDRTELEHEPALAVTRKQPSLPRSSRKEVDPRALTLAQSRFSAAMAGRNEISISLNEARSHLHGPRRSPPGSLETYEDRVRRLSKLLAQKETLLERCRQELRALDPQDRLLRNSPR